MVTLAAQKIIFAGRIDENTTYAFVFPLPKKELPLSKGETLFREVFNLRKAGRTARKWIKFDEFGQTKKLGSASGREWRNALRI
jgi:extradiol dioxygenase family protein